MNYSYYPANPDLPSDACEVSIELVRLVEDEDTGEVLEEHVIDVLAKYWPEEPECGLGGHVEFLSARMRFGDKDTPVELDDDEEDSLYQLYVEQHRSLRDEYERI